MSCHSCVKKPFCSARRPSSFFATDAHSRPLREFFDTATVNSFWQLNQMQLASLDQYFFSDCFEHRLGMAVCFSHFSSTPFLSALQTKMIRMIVCMIVAYDEFAAGLLGLVPA